MRLVIAGGGTGGHLFPGLALAEELLSRGREHAVLFMGARGGLEERVIPLHGHRLEILPSVKGGFMNFDALRKAWGGCKGYLQARRALLNFGADAVVGLGGYASSLPILAAWGVEIPSMLLEQNVIPGRTNRSLATFVNEIGVQFADSAPYFPKTHSVKLTGNPLRKKVLEVARDAALRNVAECGTGVPAREHVEGRGINERLTGEDARATPVVLVLGGSQGARALNDIAVKTWPKLKQIIPGVRMLIVAGRDDEQRTVQAFAAVGGRGQVIGFTEAVEELYAQTDVVLSRAGATTLAEVAAFALPSVLIPYPFAADDHQTANAKVFSAHGAGWLIPQKDVEIDRLAQRLADAVLQPERRRKMSMAAASLAAPRAAAEIVDRLQDLAAQHDHKFGACAAVA